MKVPAKRFVAPLLWVIVYLAISSGIGLMTRGNMGWYDTLEKSSLNPPDIVFPIVWTCLYIMLALAGWLVTANCESQKEKVVRNLYWFQMFLNWGWSFVFFEFHLIQAGFFWIVALDIALLAFIVKAWNVRTKAALLCIPTLLWGCFAAYLNYAIWIMN